MFAKYCQKLIVTLLFCKLVHCNHDWWILVTDQSSEDLSDFDLLARSGPSSVSAYLFGRNCG